MNIDTLSWIPVPAVRIFTEFMLFGTLIAAHWVVIRNFRIAFPSEKNANHPFQDTGQYG